MGRSQTRTALVHVLLVLAFAGRGHAQLENPAYVDDSPRAWELIQRAREHAIDNEGEAVRIYQELLDDYRQKLVPAHAGTDDHLVSVRHRVLEDLLENGDLLERYQLVQSAEAQRLLDAGELRLLALTRPLTTAGLDALLRLAQFSVESAQFHTSLTWLEEAAAHPEVEGRRFVHCWYLIGLVGHYLSDAALREQAMEVLEESEQAGAEVMIEHLRQLAGDTGPEVPQGLNPLDATDAEDLDELVGQTIWSAELDDRLPDRRISDARAEPSAERLARFNTMAPTVSGGVVYMNEGHTIRAMDRFTGRPLWSWGDPDGSSEGPGNDDSGDLSIVAVDGDVLVALTGHAYADRRSDGGKVVCLDADSGRLRWATRLDRIGGDDQYEGLFPHGEPMIADGHVFVLSRLVTKQQLTGCYVVALDVKDGSLVWIRHITSSGSRGRVARSFSTPCYHSGSLYIASPVGAIACVDTATGMIRWLRREHVPVMVRGRQTRPWEMVGPVLLEHRLIALSPDQRRVLVLDRETGEAIQVHDAGSRESWSEPAYLLADDQHVFAIGTGVRAFSAGDLQSPLWRFPPPPQSRLDGSTPDLEFESMGIVGRVQLTDEGLVVPTTHGIVVVDAATGAPTHRVPIDLAGNPLAVGAQLLVATADQLGVYMSLRRAEQMLRQRIAAAPHDAEPALSLLLLGMQAENLTMVMESAQLALAAIDRTPHPQRSSATRRELMTLLLEAHRRGIDSLPEQSRSLFAMIDSVAATPDQRIEYMLSYGDWAAQRAPDQAVETYQAILYDLTLRRTSVIEASVFQPAGRIAATRIGALLEKHGRQIYAPQADYADRALEHLLGMSPLALDRLAAHAVEFPFAEAGLEAARRAAWMQHETGRSREALSLLFATFDIAPTKQRAEALLGEFTDIALRSGWEELAVGALAGVTDQFGDIALSTGGGERSAAEWLASLDPPPAQLPRVGVLSKEGEVMEGVLVPHAAGIERRGPPDRALLIQEDSLRAVGLPDLQTVWGPMPIEDPGAQILSHREDELLLLLSAQGDDPRVLAMDPQTGRRRWSTARLIDHLQEPLARTRGVAGSLPNGLPLDPKETLGILSREAIYLVQRTGGVAAFDRASGALLWARDQTLPEIHHAMAHPLGLLLVGTDSSADVGEEGSGEPLPWIMLLDGVGEILDRVEPQGRAGILWAHVDAFGGLFCANAQGIQSIDLLQGRSRWTNLSAEALETRDGWLRNLYAVVEDHASGLRGVRWADGALSPPFSTAGVVGQWDRQDLKEVRIEAESLLALFVDRLVRFDHRGNVIGADIVPDDRNYRIMLHGAEAMVVVSQHDSEQVQRERGRGRTRSMYRVYVFSRNGKLLDEGLNLQPLNRRIEDAMVIDGWLLMSTRAETIAFPMQRPSERANAG